MASVLPYLTVVLPAMVVTTGFYRTIKKLYQSVTRLVSFLGMLWDVKKYRCGGESGILIRILFYLLKIPFKQGQDSIPVSFCRSPVIFFLSIREYETVFGPGIPFYSIINVCISKIFFQ